MSYDLVIKFAPAFTTERFSDPAWAADRTMYSKLRFMPGKNTIPLRVDHQDDREIGTVHKLTRWDWTDGIWHCALATLPGEPPPWLKRHAPASFRFITLHSNPEFTVQGKTVDLVYDALVTEISVLSPDRRPAEPRAEVLSIRRSEPSPAAVATSDVVAGEAWYAGAQAEAAKRGTLIRYFPAEITIR